MFYSFLIFLLFNFFSLWVIDKSITPIIKNVAKTEITRLATEAINDAVYENISKADLKKLIVIHEGEPRTYSFDPQVYTKLLSVTTKDIEKRLGIKHGGDPTSRNINDIESAQMQSIVYYIPLGVATRNSLLANLGPEIPVELSLVRDVESKLRTKMTDSGINNTLIELFIDFKVDMQIVIPYFTDEAPIKFEAKIGDLFYPGEVPKYYGGGKSLPPPAIIDEDGVENTEKGKEKDKK